MFDVYDVSEDLFGQTAGLSLYWSTTFNGKITSPAIQPCMTAVMLITSHKHNGRGSTRSNRRKVALILYTLRGCIEKRFSCRACP